MSGILPWIVVAFVLLLVFRMIVGAVKTSAKILLLLVIAVAIGAAFLWYQNQPGGEAALPW